MAERTLVLLGVVAVVFGATLVLGPGSVTLADPTLRATSCAIGLVIILYGLEQLLLAAGRPIPPRPPRCCVNIFP
jgi:hypothetical protein